MKLKASKRSKAGFSLAELMVAVAVMAVIGLAVGLNGVRQGPRLRLEGANRQLISDLRLARMQAISKRCPVRVDFDASRRAYTVWTDLNRNDARDAGEQKERILTRDKNITFWTYPTRFEFQSDGTFSSDQYYGYLSMYSSAGYERLYVFPSGQVVPR